MRYLPQDYNLVKGFTGINGLMSVDTLILLGYSSVLYGKQQLKTPIFLFKKILMKGRGING